MSGMLMRLFFRPGWRLRAVDPPIAWVRIDSPTVEVRLQLTCYLTSQFARAVRVNELRLRVSTGEEAHFAPWIRSFDIDDVPLGETLDYEVAAHSPHNAFIDFAVDDPALADELCTLGTPVPTAVEALLNDAMEFRTIAGLELGRLSLTDSILHWQRVTTGRERDGQR